jgi:hypothetical protein
MNPMNNHHISPRIPYTNPFQSTIERRQELKMFMLKDTISNEKELHTKLNKIDRFDDIQIDFLTKPLTNNELNELIFSQPVDLINQKTNKLANEFLNIIEKSEKEASHQKINKKDDLTEFKVELKNPKFETFIKEFMGESNQVLKFMTAKKDLTHRITGTLSLVMPFFCAVYEALTNDYPPDSMYFLTIVFGFLNMWSGAVMTKARVPSYDGASLRGMTNAVLIGTSMISLSLMFHNDFGANPSYGLFLGYIFAIESMYSVGYAWNDAFKHMINFAKKDFVSAEFSAKNRWKLRSHEKPSYFDMFVGAVTKKVTKEEIQYTAAPSHLTTLTPSVLIALFSMTGLVEARFLLDEPGAVAQLNHLMPDISRWASMEALLAMSVNNFGTFMGSVVVHKKLSVQKATLYTVLGFLVPLINLGAIEIRHPGALHDIINLIFTPISQIH